MISIQEAAEKYEKVPFVQYEDIVTHYLNEMKAEGYEMVKTEEWIRLHGELAGANEHIKLLEENLMQGMVKIDYEQREIEKPSPLPESEKQKYGEGFKD